MANSSPPISPAGRRLFCLTPLDTSLPEWRHASDGLQGVQILAQDEKQARYMAAARLWAPADSETPNPWLRVDRVRVRVASDIDPQLPLISYERDFGKRGRPPSLVSLRDLHRKALREWQLSLIESRRNNRHEGAPEKTGGNK